MRKVYIITALIVLTITGSYRAQIIFNYTGGSQNWTVPAGVTAICFTVEGAQGNGNASNLMLGGLGGRVTGQMVVTPGQVLQINVGGGGNNNQTAGGFNGGAPGGITQGGNCCPAAAGGGGGGASDIRINPYGLNDRVAVGGGGGGTGGNRVVGCSPGCGGGGGGGWYGGGGGGAYGGSPGAGGSQVAGGAGGPSCCGCPNGPTPGANGTFANGGIGGNVGCNNQAANNPGCQGGVGGALTGGTGPNCTGGTGCPSTWAGASGGGGSNYAAASIIGPAHAAGVIVGNGRVLIIPNCCTQPTITAVANPTAICDGYSATLTATGAGNGGSYTWTPGPMTGSSVVVSPAVTTIYTVTGSNTLNCTGTRTVQLVVNPAPNIVPSNNSPVCVGQTLFLFANPPATSYTWTGPNSFNSNVQNPNISPVTTTLASGNYTVKVTGANGCTNQAVTTVTVNPNPTITATSASVCPGTGTTLIASGASTYTWQPGNIVGSSVSFTPASTTVYTITGTSAAGCTGTTTATITVNPLPVPLPNSNSPVCTGGTINLTVNAFTSYTWTGPPAFNSNVQNPSIPNASTLMAGNYTVKVTSAQGCTAQAVINVTVNPTPTISVGNPGPYCAGSTINLTVTAAASYTWTGPLAFNSNVQNPTIANSTTNMTGPYVVTVTAVGGCRSTGTVNVVVNPVPTVTATSNSPVCLNKQINLFANPAAVSYTWSGPNSFSSNLQNPSIATASFVNGGSYTVTVTNTAGCTNTSAVTVVINPLPVVSVTGATTCVGSTFTLTAGTGTAYAWSGPNSYNTPVQNPSFANAQTTHSGNYTVVVTSAQGCTNSAVANVSVIPNPTASIIGTNTLCSQNFNSSTNTTTLTASGGGSYVWNLPAGFSASPNLSSNPITLTPPVTSTSLVATMSVIATAGSCTSQAVYQVTVWPNPTIAVTSASMCAGTQATLTASNASTYTWSPTTNLNTSTGPVVIANPANTTVYSVIGTSLGCKSQSQNGTVTVVPNPTVAVNPNPALICLNSSINLTASGATTYTWSPNIALTTTLGPNTTASPTVTTTYSIIGSQATCTNLATIQVSVIGLPTVSVIGNNTLCSQNFNNSTNTTTLTAGGASTYQWSLPAGYSASPNLSSNPIIVSPPVTSTSLVATFTVIGTAGSCTNQAVYQVTVYPNPTIAVTSASMCAGTQATLNASNAITYTWSPTTNLNTSTGPVVIANPANTTVYSVIGSSIGCNSQSQSGTVTVVPNPTVVINPNPALICLNSSINLTASGATTYTWSPNIALTTTLGPNTTASPTVTTTYSIIGSQATCTNLATIQVSVIGLPTVSVIGNNTLCSQNFNNSPATTTLTAGGASTYQWTLPAGFSASPNLSSNPIVLTPPVTTTSMVATMTVLGTAGSCTNQAVYQVTVWPNPTIAVTSASMCAGTQATLTASNASTYTWSPTTNLNTSTGPVVIANPANTTVYSVIGTSLGCNSQSQNGTVTVVANPTVVINPNPALICLNSSINLTASGATTYTWSPNIALTTTLGPNTTASPTVTTTYSIIGSQATCTNLATIQVSVIGLPTVSVIGNNTLCSQNFNNSPATTTLTAGGAATYVWTLPAGFSASPNLSSNPITVTPPVTTTSMVATMTVLGTAGTCTNQAVYTLTVYPNPTIAVTSASMCAGTQATLNASNASTYTWSPTTNLNTSTGPVVIANPANTTVHSVIGTSLGCNSQSQSGTVTVVPNPTVVINPNPALICLNSSINLTASGANNYTWTPNIALTTTLGPNTTANPTVTTTYSIIGEAATCTNLATIQVSVIGLPTVSVIGNNTLCSQNFNNSAATTTLTAGGAGSYVWTLPAGFSGAPSLNSNPITITPPVTTTSIVATMTVLGTAGTCTNQAVYTLTVYPNPTIAVTSASMCAGTQATLNASNASTYTWSPTTNLNTSTGPVVIANPANTTVYSVIGTSLGCNSQSQSGTVTVVVNPTVSINPNPALICLNSSINLTASGANNYTWTPNTALTTTLGPNTTANPTVTTTYSIIGEAATCTNLATIQVSVIGLPTISIVGTNTLCSQNFNNSPATTTLTASGAGTYVWSLPAGFSGAPSLNSNPITITPPVTTTSIVATMTVLGTAGTCTNLAYYTVTVYPNPTISTTSGSMCAGTQVTLTASNASTYTWSPSATLNTANGPSVIASPAVTTVYSVIGGSLGCNSQTGNATANVVPNPTVSVNPNPGVICLGDAVNLTASGATNYTWTPNIALSTTSGPNTTANPTATQIYSVVGEAATCTHVTTMTVTVLPLPTVSIAGTNTICSQNFNGSPNTTTLTANGAASYVWTLPAGFSGSPTLNSNPLAVTGPVTTTSLVATMTVVGTAGSCSNTATYTITVLPNPTLATTSGSMCAGTSVALSASNAQTYTWTPSATLNTANGPNVIASPALTTVYSIIGSSVGCNSQTGNATAIVVNNPTVSVSPNPGVICLGDAVNLTASGATNYTWTPNIALSTTSGPNTTANPTATQIYSVIGEAATCTHVTTMTVTVLPLPTITIVPSSPTLCMNNFNGSPNTVTLTASGANTYTWNSIVGLTTNTLNGSPIVGTSNGNPIITGSVVGANATCSNTASFTLSAIANPVIATTSGSMCAGTSVSLTASGAQTYTWTPPATLNTNSGPVVIASPTVTTVYSIIGSSVGCQGQTQNATAIVVNNPTVFITPFTPTICFGSSIGLTANGANNYTWSPNTAITSTVGTNVTVNPTVTTTYQLIGEAATCTHVAGITVTVVPLPVINIALSSPTMCMNNYNGSSNQITVIAGGATTYNWTGFSGITPNTTSGSQIVVTAIPNSPIGTGTVVGSAATCTSSATFTVIAAPNPIISVPSVSVCQFKSVDVVASGAQTYVWSPANTLNSSTGATVIASPTVTTVYSVIGSSINCQSPTQQTTVNVVANPVVVISPQTPTICSGAPIGLTAFGANNYTWTPAININTVNGAFVIVNPSVTTVYQVTGEAATCTTTAVRMVSVIPLPDLQAVAITTVICVGDKLNINANGALNYTWSPAVNLSSLYSNFVVAQPLTPITYTLVGNNGVCTKSITFSIDVKQRPVLNLSTDKPKICQGQSATIFASGATGYSFHPSPYTSQTNTTMAIVTPTASYNFSVTGFTGDSVNACPFTKEILITVVSSITAGVSWNTGVCEGQSVKLEAEGSNTYQWTPNEGLNNPNTRTPYASPKVTTVYTVIVSDGGMCPATATTMVKVNPQPTVNAGPDKTYNSDEAIYLDAKGTGTLTWIFGENILCSVCPQSQITPTRSGVYQVKTTNEFGCSATDDVWIEVTNEYPIFIPNSFTPNYDGLNDVFLVYGQGIIEFEMMVFNRWQHQIFQSNDQLKGWDGTFKGEIVKNDSYIYVINYKTYDGKKHTKTGFVLVVREDY